jgi:hypothetical protein
MSAFVLKMATTGKGALKDGLLGGPAVQAGGVLPIEKAQDQSDRDRNGKTENS